MPNLAQGRSLYLGFILGLLLISSLSLSGVLLGNLGRVAYVQAHLGPYTSQQQSSLLQQAYDWLLLSRQLAPRVQTYESLGRVATDLKDWPLALSMWNRSLTMAPDSIMIRIELGNTYAAMNQIEKAVKEWRRYPTTTLRYFIAQGHHAYRLGNNEAAINYFRMATLIDDSNPALYYNLAGLYWERGESQLSHDALEAYLQRDPKPSGKRSFALGRLLLLEGKPEALDAFREASRLDPQLTYAHYFAGTILFEQGEYEQAVGEFISELAVNPNLLGAKSHLCIIARQLQRAPLIEQRCNGVQ